ncbi:hypothetical protein ACSSV4_000618 [Roseovarius sp. MBR-154]|jgi:hypothetical protein
MSEPCHNHHRLTVAHAPGLVSIRIEDDTSAAHYPLTPDAAFDLACDLMIQAARARDREAEG